MMSRTHVPANVLVILGMFTFLVSGLAVSSFAQSAGTAEIRGTVTDPTGSAVPDAIVGVRNLDTGADRRKRNSLEGVFFCQSQASAIAGRQ